jgi:HEAT repeat protein
VIDNLLVALYDGNAAARYEAVVRLGTLKVVEVYDAIIELIETDSDFSNRHFALYTLAKLPDCRALEYLMNVLSNNLHGLREGAIGAIGLFATENRALDCDINQAVPILYNLLLKETDIQIAVNIIYTVADIATPEAKHVLISTLENPNDNPVFADDGFRKTLEQLLI